MRTRVSGFSYVEVMAAVLLLGVALVPALQSLQVGVTAAGVNRASGTEFQRLAGRMEEVLAEPLAALDAAAVAAGASSNPSSYSDAGGTASRRLVYLARFDGDNADADGNPLTGGDAGLVWVRVAIEGSALSLESLASR